MEPRRSKKRRHRNPKRSVKEKSCGVILYQESEAPRHYLLLHYPGGHWDFPKGHVEERDENETATARRELEEETGIAAVEFDPNYYESMYYEFNRGHKERVKKTVIYFLAKAQETQVKLSFEHKNWKWLPYQQAMERLTFENARELLRRAETHLTQ